MYLLSLIFCNLKHLYNHILYFFVKENGYE